MPACSQTRNLSGPGAFERGRVEFVDRGRFRLLDQGIDAGYRVDMEIVDHAVFTRVAIEIELKDFLLEMTLGERGKGRQGEREQGEGFRQRANK